MGETPVGLGQLWTSHALVPPCSELPAVGAHEQRKELWKSCMVSQAAPRAASAGRGHLQPRAGCWCWGRCMQGTCRVTQAMGPHSCMKEQSGIVAKLSVLAVAPGSLRKHWSAARLEYLNLWPPSQRSVAQRTSSSQVPFPAAQLHLCLQILQFPTLSRFPRLGCATLGGQIWNNLTIKINILPMDHNHWNKIEIHKCTLI